MSALYEDALVTLHNCDSAEMWQDLAALPLVILDPPFDKWAETPWWPNATKVCFTNHQNRADVESRYGKPRCELVWYFRDGRWVSHELPRITHESILIYGPTGSAYVGAANEDLTPRSKGSGSVGRYKYADRTYTPRPHKALNSVLEYPRNVSGEMGCWGKPVALMRDLLAWIAPTAVADPYAGGCSVAIAARELGIKTVACEKNTKTATTAARRLSATQVLPGLHLAAGENA